MAEPYFKDAGSEPPKYDWNNLPPPLTDAERACNVGDCLELVANIDLYNNEDDLGPTIVSPAGQIYRADRLFGRGWDLVRVSGEGPDYIRVMNHKLELFFRVLPTKD